MRSCSFLFCCFLPHIFLLAQPDKSILLRSPDQKIEVQIQTTGNFQYKIFYDGKEILKVGWANLETDKLPSKQEPVLRRVKYGKIVKETIDFVVPQKRSSLALMYNPMILTFSNGLQMEWRVYNEGAAYRFLTDEKDSMRIISERASFSFGEKDSVWFPKRLELDPLDCFSTSFELIYPKHALSSLNKDSIGPAPVLIDIFQGPKLAILESDVRNYPGMFFCGSSDNPGTLEAVFPGYPLETCIRGDPYQTVSVVKRESWIAHTGGTRSFPWRVMMIAGLDKDLLSNDLVYALSSPSTLHDFSWIRPGKAMDNWIIDAILYDVDFVSGNNTESYMYYIDFAAQYGLEYIMVEPVWSDLHAILSPVPEMDMKRLFHYADEKSVKLWLWTEALALQKDMEVILDSFQCWGAAGFMVDFFNRNDQLVVNQLEDIANSAARHKLMLMYHGVFPSSGFERTWPNALTREAVAGSEYNKWSSWISPDHNLTLPFIRGLSGPFDYEPLILNNATRESFRVANTHPQTQGTRASELAKLVLFPSPFQVIAGSPVDLRKDERIIRFVSQIPVCWEESLPLEASVGDYAIVARRSKESWYLAGMTDWTAREFEIALDFLPPGVYEGEFFGDGKNADRHASDYQYQKKIFRSSEIISVHLAPGGGFVIRLELKK